MAGKLPNELVFGEDNQGDVLDFNAKTAKLHGMDIVKMSPNGLNPYGQSRSEILAKMEYFREVATAYAKEVIAIDKEIKDLKEAKKVIDAKYGAMPDIHIKHLRKAFNNLKKSVKQSAQDTEIETVYTVAMDNSEVKQELAGLFDLQADEQHPGHFLKQSNKERKAMWEADPSTMPLDERIKRGLDLENPENGKVVHDYLLDTFGAGIRMQHAVINDIRKNLGYGDGDLIADRDQIAKYAEMGGKGYQEELYRIDQQIAAMNANPLMAKYENYQYSSDPADYDTVKQLLADFEAKYPDSYDHEKSRLRETIKVIESEIVSDLEKEKAEIQAKMDEEKVAEEAAKAEAEAKRQEELQNLRVHVKAAWAKPGYADLEHTLNLELPDEWRAKISEEIDNRKEAERQAELQRQAEEEAARAAEAARLAAEEAAMKAEALAKEAEAAKSSAAQSTAEMDADAFLNSLMDMDLKSERQEDSLPKSEPSETIEEVGVAEASESPEHETEAEAKVSASDENKKSMDYQIHQQQLAKNELEKLQERLDYVKSEEEVLRERKIFEDGMHNLSHQAVLDHFEIFHPRRAHPDYMRRVRQILDTPDMHNLYTPEEMRQFNEDASFNSTHKELRRLDNIERAMWEAGIEASDAGKSIEVFTPEQQQLLKSYRAALQMRQERFDEDQLAKAENRPPKYSVGYTEWVCEREREEAAYWLTEEGKAEKLLKDQQAYYRSIMDTVNDSITEYLEVMGSGTVFEAMAEFERRMRRVQELADSVSANKDRISEHQNHRVAVEFETAVKIAQDGWNVFQSRIKLLGQARRFFEGLYVRFNELIAEPDILFTRKTFEEMLNDTTQQAKRDKIAYNKFEQIREGIEQDVERFQKEGKPVYSMNPAAKLDEIRQQLNKNLSIEVPSITLENWLDLAESVDKMEQLMADLRNASRNYHQDEIDYHVRKIIEHLKNHTVDREQWWAFCTMAGAASKHIVEEYRAIQDEMDDKYPQFEAPIEYQIEGDTLEEKFEEAIQQAEEWEVQEEHKFMYRKDFDPSEFATAVPRMKAIFDKRNALDINQLGLEEYVDQTADLNVKITRAIEFGRVLAAKQGFELRKDVTLREICEGFDKVWTAGLKVIDDAQAQKEIQFIKSPEFVKSKLDGCRYDALRALPTEMQDEYWKIKKDKEYKAKFKALHNYNQAVAEGREPSLESQFTKEQWDHIQDRFEWWLDQYEMMEPGSRNDPVSRQECLENAIRYSGFKPKA